MGDRIRRTANTKPSLNNYNFEDIFKEDISLSEVNGRK